MRPPGGRGQLLGICQPLGRSDPGGQSPGSRSIDTQNLLDAFRNSGVHEQRLNRTPCEVRDLPNGELLV